MPLFVPKMFAFFLANWRLFLIVGLIASAAWYLDHRGYARAKTEAHQRELEADKAALELKQFIEDGWQKHIAEIDADLAKRLSYISDTQTGINPIIKGVRNDPRLNNPACDIPDSVRRALDQARLASHSSPAK